MKTGSKALRILERGLLLLGLLLLSGKVWYVNAPHLILSFPEGENKAYTVPDGIVFHIDGQDKTYLTLEKE
ncbi:MAG: hypothetical protein WBQ10_02510 [Terriglobales bacterium]